MAAGFLAAASAAQAATAGPPPKPAAPAPVVFHSTEVGWPGGAFALQGDGFGATPEIWVHPVDGTEEALSPANSAAVPVLARGNTVASALLPAGPPQALEAVWVKNHETGKFSDAPVFLNLARINQVEFAEIEPDRTFRLFGRNLLLPVGTPTVRFVDLNGGSSVDGAVVTSSCDAYVATVRAPGSLLAGHTYSIHYSNGLGGKWGETTADDAVLVREVGADPFGLGVPWGADFAPFAGNVYNVKTDSRLTLHAAGDGTTDDTAAIQAAINSAGAEGGGVVYLPAATYAIKTFTGGTGLTMKSRVILKGDGAGATILLFAPVTPPAKSDVGIVFPGGATAAAATTTAGLLNLMVKNGDSPMVGVRDTPSHNSKIFVSGVTIDMNRLGGNVGLCDGSDYLVTDCTIVNPSFHSSALLLQMPGSATRFSSRAILRRSVFPNMTRRLEVGGRDQIIEGNTFTYNGDYQHQTDPKAAEQNSVEFSGTQIVLLNNAFSNVGAPFINHNDGETISCQAQPLNSHSQVQQDSGTVTRASATALTDSSKSWMPGEWNDFLVAIVDGKGLGQWRWVKGNTGTRLTLDRPFDVVPPPGATYVLTQFEIDHVLIKNNTFTHTERGMIIYLGGHDVAIVNNTMNDANGIWVRCDNRPLLHRYNVAYDMLIAGNQITRTGPTHPAHITVVAYHQNPASDGTGMLGIDIRNNILTATGPPMDHDTGSIFPPYRDGYDLCVNWYGSPDPTRFSSLGVLLDSNSAVNCAAGCYISSGVGYATIANANYTNVTTPLQNFCTYEGLIAPAGVTWIDGDPILEPGNKALLFDGAPDSRVAIGHTWGDGYPSGSFSALTLGSTFTLEARVKTTSTGLGVILSTQSTVNPSLAFAVMKGKLALENKKWVSGKKSVNDGKWHHVAVTSNGSSVTFYVDGRPDTSVPFAAGQGGGAGSIGAVFNGKCGFQGGLDEVRIWNRVLTAAQIHANANRELEGSEKGLVNYWRFNQGAGFSALNHVFPTSVGSVVYP